MNLKITDTPLEDEQLEAAAQMLNRWLGSAGDINLSRGDVMHNLQYIHDARNMVIESAKQLHVAEMVKLLETAQMLIPQHSHVTKKWQADTRTVIEKIKELVKS
jgi:hypothetical protein